MQYVWIVLGALLLVALLFAAAAKALLQIGFGKRQEGNPLLHYFTAADFENLDTCPIAFQGNRGQTLRGYFYKESGRTQFKAVLIFAHGMGGGHLSYTTELDFFAKQGYLVLTYDNTGTMASDGKSLFGMAQSIYDLRAALSFVKEDSLTKDLPIVLAGHSWGAYAVSRVLAFEPAVQGVVAFSAPENTAVLLCAQAKAQIGCPVSVLKPFLQFWDLLRFGKIAVRPTSEILRQSSVPILLLHGEKDLTVPLSNAPAGNDALCASSHVQRVVYPEKQHNVYATLAAERYIAETFATLNTLLKEKASQDQLKAFSEALDFRAMCAEDPAVMQTAAAFLDACLQAGD